MPVLRSAIAQITPLLLLVSLPLLLAPATARAADDARPAIEAQYAAYDRAYAAMDLDGFMAVFASDGVWVGRDGKPLTVAELRGAMAAAFPSISKAQSQTRITSFSMDADSAIAETDRSERYTMRVNGAELLATSRSTSRDRWAKRPEGWRVVRIEILTEQMAFEPVPPPELSAAEREAVVGSIGRLARPLASVEPEAPADDLAVLDDLVGEARVVALGEFSHGSSETFRMKHRIIRHLVERKGFRVVAFEGSWAAARTLDRYVGGGEADVAQGLSDLLLGVPVWRTAEIGALIDWMRGYNTANPGARLSFEGIDMQDPVNAVACVRHGTAGLATEAAGAIDRLYPEAEEVERLLAGRTQAELARAAADAEAALQQIEASRDALLTMAPPDAYERTRHCGRVAVQALQWLAAGGTKAFGSDGSVDYAVLGQVYQLRDQAMAENVQWILDRGHPGQKVVVWAHNNHVGVVEPLLGSHLRRALGDDMVVIGFAGHAGEVRGIPVADGKIGDFTALPFPPVPTGGISDLLSAAGRPLYVLDLRKVPAEDPLGRWMATPRLETSFGYLTDATRPEQPPTVLATKYDALVFIERSTAAKPLP